MFYNIATFKWIPLSEAPIEFLSSQVSASFLLREGTLSGTVASVFMLQDSLDAANIEIIIGYNKKGKDGNFILICKALITANLKNSGKP